MEALFQDDPVSEPEDGFQESPRKCGTATATATSMTQQSVTAETTANGCFDCNICLDFAVDPVVTLCGHLYCWPCIYKWLELDGATPQHCPVCKATLSETTLVPLYGRGNTVSDKEPYVDSIPRRPSIRHRGQTLAASLVEPNHHPGRRRRRQQHGDYGVIRAYSGDTSQSLHGVPHLLGSAAVAVLPWVFGEHVTTGLQYSNRYYLIGEAATPAQRRQEMLASRSLHRIFVFLFCFMILCLLLF